MTIDARWMIHEKRGTQNEYLTMNHEEDMNTHHEEAPNIINNHQL